MFLAAKKLYFSSTDEQLPLKATKQDIAEYSRTKKRVGLTNEFPKLAWMYPLKGPKKCRTPSVKYNQAIIRDLAGLFAERVRNGDFPAIMKDKRSTNDKRAERRIRSVLKRLRTAYVKKTMQLEDIKNAVTEEAKANAKKKAQDEDDKATVTNRRSVRRYEVCLRSLHPQTFY